MGTANRDRRRVKAAARRKAQARRATSGGGRPRPRATTDPGGDRFEDLLDDALPAPPPITSAFGLSGGAAAAPGPSVPERVAVIIDNAVFALDRADSAQLTLLVSQLATAAAPGWRRAVQRRLDDVLTAAVTALWGQGWQPADLVRVVTRRLAAPHVRLTRAVVAAELTRYSSASIDPRWASQLAEAGVSIWWERRLSAVQACAEDHPGGWPGFVRCAIEVAHLMARLPRLETLTAVPGTATHAAAARAAGLDERILARVRAMLAKAESTDYPAEAETFTAGAQALMARHSIDHAMLAATGRAPGDEPTGRRIGIDTPYEAPKAALLDGIAAANNCRSAWSRELGSATVVGFPTDLDLVEVLFTSLLVQATVAVNRQGSKTDGVGRSRTRSFRQSFLLSYAGRIRERLAEATRQQTAAAAAQEAGERLLPVLASRTEAVDAVLSTMFPHLSQRSVGSAWDGEGWASGRVAADRASLGPPGELPG